MENERNGRTRALSNSSEMIITSTYSYVQLLSKNISITHKKHRQKLALLSTVQEWCPFLYSYHFITNVWDAACYDSNQNSNEWCNTGGKQQNCLIRLERSSEGLATKRVKLWRRKTGESLGSLTYDATDSRNMTTLNKADWQ